MPTCSRSHTTRLKSNKERLAQLIELQHHMEQALLKWQVMPDGAPDGDSICSLIESIDLSVVKQPNQSATSIDPVCGMEVSQEKGFSKMY